VRKEHAYGPLALIAVWYLACWLKLVNPLFLPTPHVVAVELASLMAQGAVWKDLGWTLWRIILGFVLATVVGIPVGLLMGQSRRIYATTEVLVDFFRSLPALAIFPLLMFMFGIGDAAKIATCVFGCSLVVVINSYYGVIQSRKTRKTVAELMGANPAEVFAHVTLMDALPQVFVGLRTSLSLAVVIIIVTEMFVGTNHGVGHRIFEAQLTYRVAEMYAAIIIAGLLGYGLNRAFVGVEHRIVHWSGR